MRDARRNRRAGTMRLSLTLLGDFQARIGPGPSLAEPRGMRPVVAQCHLALGRLRRRLGHDAVADDHLAMAAAMFREMGMASHGSCP